MASAGFYAGLVMCTSVGTFLYTRTMIPQAIYALEFTAGFYLFLRAWQGTLSPRLGYWGFAAMAALATLTHGLVGVIFPVAVVALFLLWTGGWRRWRELPWLSSALIYLAIALPWHLVVAWRVPGFLSYYIFNEHILRALGARYPQDSSTVLLPLWWLLHLAWFFPWSFFAPLALAQFPRHGNCPAGFDETQRVSEERSRQARLLLFLWAGFILFFFSLTRRMEYYSFGAWPAIALLLGLGLARAEEERHRWLPRLQAALALGGVLVAAVLGGLVWVSRNVRTAGDISGLLQTRSADFYKVAMANTLDLTPQAFAALRGPSLVTAFALLIGLGAAWLLRRRGRALAATLSVALTASIFLFAANRAFGLFSPHLSSREIAREIAAYLGPGDRILLYGDFYNGCTVSFYTHRKVWLWNGRYNSLEYGSSFPDAPQIFLTDQQFSAFWSGPQRVFLVVPEFHRRVALARLPPDSAFVLSLRGKGVFVNQPVEPGQPTLAELRARHETRAD